MLSKIKYVLFSLFCLLSSCSLSLFTGSDHLDDLNRAGNFSMTIPNPYYDSTQQDSRALAFEGKFLYVEIAEMKEEKVAMYEDRFIYSEREVKGDGIWDETPEWGSHAIYGKEVDFSKEKEFRISFTDIPTDRKLFLRVIEERSYEDLQNNMDQYDSKDNDGNFIITPLVSSYGEDEAVSDTHPWGYQTLFLSPEQIAEGPLLVTLVSPPQPLK